MRLDHQYEVTIVCHPPWRPMQTSETRTEVYTVRGDYETVSKALGSPGSNTRDQLDRFEESLSAPDVPPGVVG